MDSILDKAETGPRQLAIPEIAKLMVACLRDGEQRFHRYRLHAFVVMPNHVHMLITPSVLATKWLGPLKGFTYRPRAAGNIRIDISAGILAEANRALRDKFQWDWYMHPGCTGQAARAR
jgi:REP element-mobilizing transposase RayT